MSAIPARLDIWLRLIRFDRPIGSLLLLWPTLWGVWLAGEGTPSPKNVLIFVLGVFLMRSAGCILNDIADRDFDRHVERTRQRPLTSGEIGVAESLAVCVVLAMIAFLLVLQTNRLTVLLSVAGLALAAGYPYLKRHTHLPQIGLGLAFSWGIPMAFAAERGVLPAESWLLFCAAAVWSVVYDTFYAMVDRDDDLRIGVRSTAILFGDRDREFTSALQGLTLLLLVLVGREFGLGPVYYAALVTGAATFVWQQWLIRHRERDK